VNHGYIGLLVSINQFNEIFFLWFGIPNVNIRITLLLIFSIFYSLLILWQYPNTVVCGRILCEFETMPTIKLTFIAYALILRLKRVSKSKPTLQFF
jgi:hypothetical protein